MARQARWNAERSEWSAAVRVVWRQFGDARVGLLMRSESCFISTRMASALAFPFEARDFVAGFIALRPCDARFGNQFAPLFVSARKPSRSSVICCGASPYRRRRPDVPERA